MYKILCALVIKRNNKILFDIEFLFKHSKINIELEDKVTLFVLIHQSS